MKQNVSLVEVVKAQVALLFGKYRPVGGLSEDEQRAIRAERVEFCDRLVALLGAIDAPQAAVVEQVRLVTREVYSDGQPRNLPSVESLCGLVKRAFTAGRQRPLCFGCVDMGGRYHSASPDEPLRAKATGEIPFDPFGWLCMAHHRAVVWYEDRERWRRNIAVIQDRAPMCEYPPIEELLPRGAWRPQPPADDPKWTSWTDGANMGPLALWARAFVKRAYGHDVAESDAPLLDAKPVLAEESDEWTRL